MNLKNYIATIQDHPVRGIIFRDITPLLKDGDAFNYSLELMCKFVKKVKPDVIVGPESRGFIFGTPLASKFNIGFVPVRKPNKLPREVISYSYKLEYGENKMEIHKDDIKSGQKILIVDDLLATGGTIEATIKLVEKLGAEVVGCVFLIHLKDLNGLEKLKDYNVKFLLEY